MLFKYLIIIGVLIRILTHTRVSNYCRLGRLPGDIHWVYKKISIHLPFTSTLILLILLYILVRLI